MTGLYWFSNRRSDSASGVFRPGTNTQRRPGMVLLPNERCWSMNAAGSGWASTSFIETAPAAPGTENLPSLASS